MRKLCGLVLLVLCAASVEAQGPWSSIIPDPDTYDWSNNNRPGYRYRGMTSEQQRFFDYVRAKRARGQELSSAEQAMIRWMQKNRRWPEAPVPNEFWAAFLRYLREQPSQNMNLAQRTMLAEAHARGLIPVDRPVGDDGQKLVDYLQSRSYRARGWLQRWFGRIEPWIDSRLAASGVDMQGAADGDRRSISIEDGPAAGVAISYTVNGMTLGEYEDHRHMDSLRRSYVVSMAPGTVTISGTFSAPFDSPGSTTATVHISAGEHSLPAESFDFHPPGTRDFSVSLQVPENTDFALPRSTGFHIRFSVPLPGQGFRSASLLVTGHMEADSQMAEAERDRADAEWREEVERTLRELGYEQTPAGQELARMRTALAGGDQAWRDYVDLRQRELGYQEGPEEVEFDRLHHAIEAGGDTWAQYVSTGSLPPPGQPTAGAGTQPAPTTPQVPLPPPTATHPAPPAPSGTGGMVVGTGTDGDAVTGVGNHFQNTSTVTGGVNYQNLPPNSTAIAIWSLNGNELARGRGTIGGTGTHTFTLRTDDGQNLPNGDYTVTVMVGDTVLGSQSFTIGGRPVTEPTGGRAQAVPLAITHPGAGQKITRNLTIRGTAPPRSRVRVTTDYWYRVLVEGYATLYEKELTADDAGNWATEELDMRPPLSGMSRSYRIKVERLGADGAVVQEQQIEVRGQ